MLYICFFFLKEHLPIKVQFLPKNVNIFTLIFSLLCLLLSFQSPNKPTLPQEKIRPLTSLDHPQSPFYDPEGGAITPVARVIVERIARKVSLAPLHHLFADILWLDHDAGAVIHTEWWSTEPLLVYSGGDAVVNLALPFVRSFFLSVVSSI